MIQRAVLYAVMLVGWSCSCDAVVVCNESADCSSGAICMEGICLDACNNDCDCLDGYTCGPVGACIPGASQCVGNQIPLCGGADLNNDPGNCGACGRQCVYPNAFGQCSERTCSLARCRPGFYDIDQRSDNGCEYSCTIDITSPEETCDGRDNNCDGQVDEGLELTWYRDQDRDGVGATHIAVQSCLRPEGFVSASGDCDDEDPTRFPGGTETCDGRDNDCDDEIDEDALRPYYVDNDGDGFGNPDLSTIRCAAAAGEVELGTDCDDNDPQRHPGKLEVCDEIDNNCEIGLTDEPYLSFFLDQDGDGFGRSDSEIKACRRPDGYALDSGDCNDASANDHPNAVERCDGLDNNCNQQVDEGLARQPLYPDQDGDGYGAVDGQMTEACLGTPHLAEGQTDCDDSDSSRHPGAQEWCDGIDQNCDRIIDNNLSIRSDNSLALANISGAASQLCADANEVRWRDRPAGANSHIIMRRSFDAQDSQELINGGDITPLTLNNYGQSNGLLDSANNRCRLSIAGGAWQVIGPDQCRPLAVCPPLGVGAQTHWSVILGVTTNNSETANLYTLDHQANIQLVTNLITGDAITHASCINDGYLALAVEREGQDTIYVGPPVPVELRAYDSRIIALDLIANDQSGSLLTLTRADGIVEIEALDHQGSSLARRTAVGAPKIGGAARLISAPGGAVLIYPILQPAFERGVWATPIAYDTTAKGSEHRVNQEAVDQTVTTATQSQTAGMGSLYYVTESGLRSVFLGCAPP